MSLGQTMRRSLGRSRRLSFAFPNKNVHDYRTIMFEIQSVISSFKSKVGLMEEDFTRQTHQLFGGILGSSDIGDGFCETNLIRNLISWYNDDSSCFYVKCSPHPCSE